MGAVFASPSSAAENDDANFTGITNLPDLVMWVSLKGKRAVDGMDHFKDTLNIVGNPACAFKPRTRYRMYLDDYMECLDALLKFDYALFVFKRVLRQLFEQVTSGTYRRDGRLVFPSDRNMKSLHRSYSEHMNPGGIDKTMARMHQRENVRKDRGKPFSAREWRDQVEKCEALLRRLATSFNTQLDSAVAKRLDIGRSDMIVEEVEEDEDVDDSEEWLNYDEEREWGT